jgi:hypothetical protein
LSPRESIAPCCTATRTRPTGTLSILNRPVESVCVVIDEPIVTHAAARCRPATLSYTVPTSLGGRSLEAAAESVRCAGRGAAAINMTAITQRFMTGDGRRANSRSFAQPALEERKRRRAQDDG